MAHSTGKVPISGADAHLILAKHPHVGSTTGAAGSTSVLILTFLSFRISAAARRSSSLAPVHEPMYALLSSVPCSSLAAEIFPGENGLATVGSIFSISYVKTSE